MINRNMKANIVSETEIEILPKRQHLKGASSTATSHVIESGIMLCSGQGELKAQSHGFEMSIQCLFNSVIHSMFKDMWAVCPSG